MTKQELSELLDEKLKGVAAKDDLATLEKRLTSVEERMATQKDLAKLEARMATKEDLKAFATKKDLAKLESGIRHVLEKGIIPQLDQLYTRVEDVSDTIGRIDRRLEAVINRQDRQGEVLEKYEEKSADHEQRLGILEASAS